MRFIESCELLTDYLYQFPELLFSSFVVPRGSLKKDDNLTGHRCSFSCDTVNLICFALNLTDISSTVQVLNWYYEQQSQLAPIAGSGRYLSSTVFLTQFVGSVI